MDPQADYFADADESMEVAAAAADDDGEVMAAVVVDDEEIGEEEDAEGEADAVVVPVAAEPAHGTSSSTAPASRPKVKGSGMPTHPSHTCKRVLPGNGRSERPNMAQDTQGVVGIHWKAARLRSTSAVLAMFADVSI